MGDYSEKSGFDQMQRLLQLKDRPQAVLIANDAMAVGALRALHEKQIDVPKEMALISFDDTSITHYTYPTLTSIHVPTDQMAAMGIELLGRRLQNPDLAPQRVVVGTKLILRQSTENWSKNPKLHTKIIADSRLALSRWEFLFFKRF